MSVAEAVVVRLTDPPGYLNVPPAKAKVRLGVPSLVRTNVNEVALLVIVLGVANVSVALPFSVAVKTFPSSQSIVLAVPVLPNAVTRSENTPDIKLEVTLNSPVPLGVILRPTLASPPEGVIVGLLPVAALANVISLTAEAVAVKFINSKPPVSRMLVPILGLVIVLLVIVWVSVVPIITPVGSA